MGCLHAEPHAVAVSPPLATTSSRQVITPASISTNTSHDLGCDDQQLWQHNSSLAENPDLSNDFPANLGQSRIPLHLAILNGNESRARFLLERGADITLRDSSGSTALHLAAESENESVIKLVLEKFTDANQTDYTGRSALFIAIQKKDEVLAKLLLEAYVDVNLKDISDHTALHVAVEMNSVEMAALLLTYGARIDL